MAKRRIHIENLRIKLPSAMRPRAHSIAHTIGGDIASAVASAANGRNGKIAIDEISIGQVRDTSSVGTKAANSMNEILNGRRSR